jgi:hypothetical protein
VHVCFAEAEVWIIGPTFLTVAIFAADMLSQLLREALGIGRLQVSRQRILDAKAGAGG